MSNPEQQQFLDQHEEIAPTELPALTQADSPVDIDWEPLGLEFGTGVDFEFQELDIAIRDGQSMPTLGLVDFSQSSPESCSGSMI
jgi:hypothetical protein